MNKEQFSIYDRKSHCAIQFSKYVKLAWSAVFPNSSCMTNGDSYGNFVFFYGHLTRDAAELENGMLFHDPIQYIGVYRGEDLGYREELVGVYVKSPEGDDVVYRLSKLEPINIYKPTYKDLLNRFYDVRRLVLNNLDGLQELGFDVKMKLGV